MIEGYTRTLIVERLKAAHIYKLASIKQATRVSWLREMLLRGWIANAENAFSGLLPSRQPTCLVAIEEEKIIGLVSISPSNLKGTCWFIELHEFHKRAYELSLRQVIRHLVMKSIELKAEKAQSWVIKCSSNDVDRLAILRELGFQPLKVLKTWHQKENPLPNSEHNLNHEDLPIQFSWQKINSGNAHLLWKLEQSSQSGHLRQIMDRNWRDFLNQKSELSGVLTHRANNNSIAIAGLVVRNIVENRIYIELLRDIAWDERLTFLISHILKDFALKDKEVILQTSSEDTDLSTLLTELGWFEGEGEILSVRTIWRRQEKIKTSLKTKSLESILEGLNPQTPPLPTPSLGPR